MSSNTTEPLPEVEEEEPVVRAKDKIKQFEKASTAQVVSEERQRQRAKFESRLNRFKSVDESNNGLDSSGGSPFARSNSTEVRNKAEYFANMAQAEEREKESRERKESFQRMKSGFEAVEIKESAAGGIGPKVKESAAKFTYDELKEEKERKEKEEARLKKEEFKSKHSMFEGGGSGGTNGKVDSGGEEKKKGDGGDSKKISVTS